MVPGWSSLNMPNWQLQDRCNTSFLGANAQHTTVFKGQKQDLESFLHWLLICLNVSNYPSLNGRLVSHLTKNVGSGEPLVGVQWISIYIYIYIHNSRNPSEVSKVSPPKTQSRFLSNIAIISHYKGGVCTIHFYIGLSRLFVTFFNLKIPSLHLWQYLTDPNPGSKGLPSGKLSTFIGPFKVTQDSASMSSCARVSVSVSKEWTYIYPWHSMLAILSYMPNVSILRQHSQCWLLEPTFIKIGVIEHPYLSKDVYIYAPQVWSSLEAIGFELCILCYRVRALIWPWP